MEMKKAGKIINVKNAFFVVFCLYIISVFVRFSLIPHLERLTVCFDELRSYGVAESIATGRAISVFNVDHYYTEILYSTIISPAFLFRTNRIIQFRIIAVINCLFICSGIFPTYLLAKRISRGKETVALFFSCAYCLLPDLTYSLLIYNENIQLPLSMWFIYTLYVGFEDYGQVISLKYIAHQILIGILFSILYLSKLVSLIFPLSYLCVLIYELVVAKVTHVKDTVIKKRWFGFLISVTVSILLLSMFFGTFLRNKSFLRAAPMGAEVLDSPAKYLYLLYGVLYYLLNVVLASGIVPVIFPLVGFNKLKPTEKLLYVFLMVALGGLAIVNSYTCSVREDFPRLVPKANVRYACWFFLPIWMLYANTVTEQFSVLKKWILAILGALIGILYMAVYKGVHHSQADETMLGYLGRFSDEQSLLVCICITIFLLVCVFLFFISPKVHVFFFGSAMLIILLYNNIYYTKDRIRDHSISETDFREISIVEGFIRNHPDEEFLYIYNSRSIDNYVKLGDTYLNYQNVTRISLYDFIKCQKEDGSINLSDVGNERINNLGHIDYLIMEQDWEAQFTNHPVVDATNSEYYDVLSIADGDKKTISAIEFWWTVPLGTKKFEISKPKFFTQFDEDDAGGFVSRGSEKGSLLFGPYTTLPKGQYDITFIYTYNGDLPEGTALGSVGIRGSESLSSYDTAFYAGEDSVTISNVNINDFCTQFETLMRTSNSNIRVSAITITRKN